MRLQQPDDDGCLVSSSPSYRTIDFVCKTKKEEMGRQGRAREFTVSMAFANFSLLTFNTFSPYRQILKLDVGWRGNFKNFNVPFPNAVWRHEKNNNRK